MCTQDKNKSIYDFTVKDIDGNEINMSKYYGQVLLITNVASKCSFTEQYEGLEKLQAKYHSRGFNVIAFPCNQFGGQEPKSNEDIKTFVKTHYCTTFPIMAKIEVNGDNTALIYQYLKSAQTGILWTKSIKWNFTKFLIDKHGHAIQRYGPNTSPEDLADDIDEALQQQ